MWKTQKNFEENITVLNEGNPSWSSGGVAVIADGTSQIIKAVIMPDDKIHRERRRDGQFSFERIFAHVRRDEMDKIDMIPGKTRIEWNGNEYVVHLILDYRTKFLFQNAEIEMRRRLDID